MMSVTNGQSWCPWPVASHSYDSPACAFVHVLANRDGAVLGVERTVLRLTCARCGPTCQCGGTESTTQAEKTGDGDV